MGASASIDDGCSLSADWNVAVQGRNGFPILRATQLVWMANLAIATLTVQHIRREPPAILRDKDECPLELTACVITFMPRNSRDELRAKKKGSLTWGTGVHSDLQEPSDPPGAGRHAAPVATSGFPIRELGFAQTSGRLLCD